MKLHECIRDPRRPSLNELRTCAHKQEYQRIGSWPARKIARPAAIYGTWVAVRLNMSANQITLAATAVVIIAAALMSIGSPTAFFYAILLHHLAYWLDHVDGQVARWNRTASLDGVYLDYLLHYIWNLTLGFGLGFGLTNRTGQPLWSALGFSISLGWTLLSLHNDCRYKAVFQRLKSDTRSFRIDSGTGGRPSPAPGRPKHGIGRITWPLAKACELPTVLMFLTVIGSVAYLYEPLWEFLWISFVGVMGVVAPTLATGRIVRAVGNGSVEREFSAWFQPLDKSSQD